MLVVIFLANGNYSCLLISASKACWSLQTPAARRSANSARFTNTLCPWHTHRSDIKTVSNQYTIQIKIRTIWKVFIMLVVTLYDTFTLHVHVRKQLFNYYYNSSASYFLVHQVVSCIVLSPSAVDSMMVTRGDATSEGNNTPWSDAERLKKVNEQL